MTDTTILCGRTNPQCAGKQLHDECYGRPACPTSRFEWVNGEPRRVQKRRSKEKSREQDPG